jgi:hypothetical protein
MTPSFLVELKGDCYISADNLIACNLLSYVLDKDKWKYQHFQLCKQSHISLRSFLLSNCVGALITGPACTATYPAKHIRFPCLAGTGRFVERLHNDLVAWSETMAIPQDI